MSNKVIKRLIVLIIVVFIIIVAVASGFVTRFAHGFMSSWRNSSETQTNITDEATTTNNSEATTEHPANEEVIVYPDAEVFIYNAILENPTSEYDVCKITLISASTNSVLLRVQNVTDYPIEFGVSELKLDDITYSYDTSYPEIIINANGTENYYFTAPKDGEEFMPISNPDFSIISGYYSFDTENEESDMFGICTIFETTVK